jgi:hypothetical protein
MEHLMSRIPARLLARTSAVGLAVAAALMPAMVQTQTAPNNLTAIWWTPSESGWGLNLSHQGNAVFAAWYTYRADGQSQWLTALLNRQANGTYQGDILRTQGLAFDKINSTSAFVGQPVAAGNATLTEQASGSLDFRYTLDGVTQTKRVERLLFGQSLASCGFTTQTRAAATNMQDLWFNTNEPGWGISLTQQGDAIFAAWYTYRQDGSAQWLTALVNRTSAGSQSFEGAINRATGTPFDRINAQPALGTVAVAGSIRFDFTNGETGTMRYTLDGITQTKSIQRFVFASPTTVCASPAPPPPAAPPTNAAELLAWLQAGSYKSWAKETAIHPAASPHPTNVLSYANDVLEQSLRVGNANHPVNSATVKEIYTSDNRINGYAVAIKTQANSDGGRGWYWYEILGTASGPGSVVAASNGAGGCTGCHSAGVDYIRTRFPFQR